MTDSSVKLTIYGKIIDSAYTNLLIQKTDLNISDILALDRIQKGLSIDDEKIIRNLRHKKLIEGRKPHLHISNIIAQVSPSEKRAQYILEKGQEISFYEQQIINFLRLKPSHRHEIEDLLLKQLSTVLSTEQKKRKITNILLSLKRKNKIRCKGTTKAAIWEAV